MILKDAATFQAWNITIVEINSGVHLLKSKIRELPLFTSGGLGLGIRLVIDGRALFYSKQVFGPHTAKSQPIWIKFCTHLLLHLWANLDCDRRMGGSRSNQNYYVFCNTCNAP